MIAKYNSAPAEALSVEYDAALGSMTDEGWVTGDISKDEIATRAELIET